MRGYFKGMGVPTEFDRLLWILSTSGLRYRRWRPTRNRLHLEIGRVHHFNLRLARQWGKQMLI